MNRLHQDKQQLLMSFLNLQASKTQRSHDVSKANEDDDDEEDESEDESGMFRQYHL